MGKNARKKVEVTKRGARETSKPTGLFLWQEWAVGDIARERTAEGDHRHCCTDGQFLELMSTKKNESSQKGVLREKLAL